MSYDSATELLQKSSWPDVQVVCTGYKEYLVAHPGQGASLFNFCSASSSPSFILPSAPPTANVAAAVFASGTGTVRKQIRKVLGRGRTLNQVVLERRQEPREAPASSQEVDNTRGRKRGRTSK